jgi:glycosyltransferase involved in cell wall biosynthesis
MDDAMTRTFAAANHSVTLREDIANGHFSRPTVSIIISSYNYERLIGSTIEGALAQTYPLVEVICVDDGSSDNSRQVIATYEGSIKTLFKPNGGQGSAMNAGFLMSKGDIVLFLDSDDQLMPTCVESIVNKWEDKWSSAHVGIRCVDESNGPASRPGWMLPYHPSGNLIDVVLATGGIFHPPTSANAFARAYLEKVLPMPEEPWRTHPDVYLCFLAALYGDIGRIDEELCLYRVHPSAGSLTKNGKIVPQRCKRELIFKQEIEQELRKHAALLGRVVTVRPLSERHYYLKMYLMWRKVEVDTGRRSGAEEGLGLSLWQIWRAIIRTALASDDLSITKKLAYISWATLVSLLPRNSAELLIIRTDPSCAKAE